MRHFLLSLSLFLSVSVYSQDIKSFVNHQMTQFPKSHLLDIYKTCFQDYMGAEHLVSDREHVKAYLDEELYTTEIDNLPNWYYEPCGIKGRYVRVSLRTVKEGLVTEDILLDAFIRSANMERPSVRSWKRRWHRIIGTIDEMGLNLPDYDREKRFIDSILSAGKYAISHSSDYRNAYHPHYRIVERHIFEKELQPLINERCESAAIPVQGKDVGFAHIFRDSVISEQARMTLAAQSVQEHSPSVLIVMYDAEIGKEPLLKAIKEYKVEIIYDYNIINGMALKKPEGKSLEETMRYFKTVKGVTNVEYDHIIRLTDPVKPKMEIK